MKGFARKLLILAVAAAAFAGASFTQHALNHDRGTLGLTRAAPLENAPPALAFTTVALGGFRGLIANALWIRVTEMQEQGRYFEIVQLADWIAKLQPQSAMVWRYQAWNMTYNISVKFRDPADRWRWVQRGIELLRDEGLKLHPYDSQMYHELAWFFQHKMGYFLDDAHLYYKQQWANEMSRVLGTNQAGLTPLVQPRTAEEQTRAARLRNEFKLDPQRMQAIDERFGPLEWRLPEAHAIYWASLGLERTPKAGQLALRRVIWQSMQTAFLRGRLVPVGPLKQFQSAPNLEIISKANKAYEQMMAEAPEDRDAMITGHRNFLVEAVFQLYLHNRVREAEQWLAALREKYPEAVPAGRSLDEFALERLNQQVDRTSLDRVRALIEGLLVRAYVSLAIGQADEAAGHERLAQYIWRKHQTKFADQQERMGLPPLKELREQVLGRLLDSNSPQALHPELRQQLRTELKLPAPPAR